MTQRRVFSRLPQSFWWSLLIYAALTAWQGRDVLRGLYTDIVHDVGDPLLNAAILSWNAQNVPWTQSWWNLPIFAPTPDALTFSEHLLGITPISTPLYWLSGSGLAAYNLTALLMFPLCGGAMFLLAYELTGSGPASFLSGLAFAFAPYRVSHLPHIQVLAALWMPLSLLGLHKYLKSGSVRALALFGAAWFLQGAANLYYLVFFSVLVAMWVVWFVLLRGRWTRLWQIAAASILAALPLLPILYRYATVHHMYGFSRSEDEIAFYSADVAGVFCASELLRFWGWLKIGCKPEGELFAGLTLPLVCLVAVLFLARSAIALPAARLPRIAVRIAAGVAVVYLATALSVWWWGRWRVDLGPISVSASSFTRPFSVALWASAAAIGLTATFGRLSTGSAGWFYAIAAAVTWMMALGPVPRLAHDRAFEIAPYSWLMALPGVDGLRVPSRFWMITVLCLAALMGLLVSAALARVRRPVALILTVVVACGIAMDGWLRIPSVDAPDMLWADRLHGSTVVELPIEEVDVAAGVRAVEGGWRTVNGYSGYRPPSWEIARAASRASDASLLPYVDPSGVVHVLVHKGAAALVQAVARTAGSPALAESSDWLLYRVPQRAPTERVGARLKVTAVDASCNRDIVQATIDGHRDIAWECGPQLTDEHLTLDLGQVSVVGAVRHIGGARALDHPRELVIDTSEDRATWQHAWIGGVAGLVFRAAAGRAENVTIVLPLEPRRARYIRLRQTGRDPRTVWAVAEIEAYAPAAASPVESPRD